MKKLSIIIITILAVSLFLSTNLPAKQRAIRVKTRTVDGSTKEIQLYSEYYALVVGCGLYKKGWPRLPNPVRDAMEVKKALKKLGFEVKIVKNPNSQQLLRALNGLVSGAGNDPRKGIFVFFAGHGHTLTRADGTKLGYIVPIDAPDPEKDLTGFMTKAVSMRVIEEISTLMKAKHVLMAFDSCFSGAIFRTSPGRPSQYIREQVAKPVRAFITAGNENERVPDESVFKTCLLQGLMDRYADRNKDGYVTGEELGLYLKEEVVNYTKGAQHPQYGKINNPNLDKGDFIFRLGRAHPARLAKLKEKEKAKRRELDRLARLEAEDRKARLREQTEIRRMEDKLGNLDAQIVEMKKRLGTQSEKSEDSLDAMLAMVRKKEEEQRRLEELKRKRQEEEAKRRAEIWRLKAEKLKEDIRKYQEIVSSKFGKKMKAMAWKRLVEKYPDEAGGVDIGDTDLLLAQAEYGHNITDRNGIFFALTNGIVRDIRTGLEWVAGPDRDMTWDEAKSWVESLNIAGEGWRMPKIAELKTLYKKGTGTRNMTTLLKTSSRYVWSSEKDSKYAYAFDFNNGVPEYRLLLIHLGWKPGYPRYGYRISGVFAVRSQR